MSNLFLKLEVKLAKKKDLLLGPGIVNRGQVVFLGNPESNNMSGPHVLDQFTSTKHLEKYFLEKAIYISVEPIEYQIELVFNTKLRKEFQHIQTKLDEKLSSKAAPASEKSSVTQ